MKIKTSELVGNALNLMVSRANNPPGKDGIGWFEYDQNGYLFDPLNERCYSPSSIWEQGGPIIEREGIAVFKNLDDGWQAVRSSNVCQYRRDEDGELAAGIIYRESLHAGPTPLIAAMRCFVTYKLGDEVDVPMR